MRSPPTARIKGGQRCEDPRASPDCFLLPVQQFLVRSKARDCSWVGVAPMGETNHQPGVRRRWACHCSWGCNPWWTLRSARAPCTSPTSSSTNSTTASTPILPVVRNTIQAPLLTHLPAFTFFCFRMYSSIVCIQDEVAVWSLVLLSTDLGIFNFGLQMVLGHSFVQGLSQISVWLRSIMLCFVKSPYIIDFIHVLILLNLLFM